MNLNLLTLKTMWIIKIIKKFYDNVTIYVICYMLSDNINLKPDPTQKLGFGNLVGFQKIWDKREELR